MAERKVILKEKAVFVENGQLYLKLVYEYEDDRGIHELIIPKMELQIQADSLPLINRDEISFMTAGNCYIKSGSNTFDLARKDISIRKNGETLVAENAAYVINTLEEKSKEMTLSEIEKKLGYKVKLVSEERKDE